MKWLIVLALLGVLAALASAGIFMLKGGRREGETQEGADKRMARALAVRVGLSVALFLIVLLAWWMGWITPTGVPR